MRPHGYRWAAIGEGDGGTFIVCIANGNSQGVANLVPAARLTAHHDTELAALTEQVNAILSPVRERLRDDGTHLAMIETPDGWMLAWTRNEHEKDIGQLRADNPQARVVTLEDDSDEDIRRELGLVGS